MAKLKDLNHENHVDGILFDRKTPKGPHMEVGIHEAKTKPSKLIPLALAGEETVIAKAGNCEFLKQHNIFPQFLADTEVSVLMLDLMNRTSEYPMEYIVEALAAAPTSWATRHWTSPRPASPWRTTC